MVNLSRWLLAARMFACLALPLAALVCANAQTSERPLTTAQEVRSLSTEDAAKSLPVVVDCVVLGHAEPHHQSFILVDQQGDSLYAVDLTPPVTPLKTGQRIRAIGHTDPGGYAPMLVLSSVEILGVGTLPTPLPVTLSDLNAGGLDSKWVETYGIVRSCRVVEHGTLPGGRASLIELAYGNERVSLQAQFATNPEELVDAEIRFRAICVNRHNHNRQFIRPALIIPEDGVISIESLPKTPPFERQPAEISSLLEFYPNINYHHRVHIQGTVLHSIAGDSIWVRDATRAIRVKTSQEPGPPPGSQVSVAGFLYSDAYSPALEDAEFRLLNGAQATKPKHLAAFPNAFDNDSDLVQFSAILVDKRTQRDGISLHFEWEDSEKHSITGALFSSDLKLGRLPAIGSLVEVTGICSIIPVKTDNVSGILNPETFEILVRDSSDIRLLEPPPFWKTKTVLWLLVILLALATLTALAIYIAAKQRLKEQAHRRAMAETEFSAIIKERDRLSREIHDTLSQGLGATSVQLELAKNLCTGTPDSLLHHIATAHQIVRASLTEARASIWNMRSQILENSDLPDALTAILHQLTDQTGVQANSEITGSRRRLSTTAENNLLRIGQEAITNATKHAQAARIDLKMTFKRNEICLEVIDDGKGFDRAHDSHSTNSFGLLGMKERADEIGAEINVISEPGQGTKIQVSFSG